MKKIVVDGIEYKPVVEENSDIKIAILQRGWVFIGRFKQDGDNCVLNDAQCIRTWGTTGGLGELASNGPTSSTKLDPHGKVAFHVLTSVALIDCEKSKWDKKLS